MKKNIIVKLCLATFNYNLLIVNKIFKLAQYLPRVKSIQQVSEHKLFQILMYIKALFGFIESTTGIILLIAGSRSLTRFVQWIFGQELLRDPTDPIGNFFMNLAQTLSLRMHIFFGVYLIVHGFIHVSVVLALIHKKRWAFKLAGIVLTLFMMYQIYQLIRSFSIVLFIFTIIDIIILSLLKVEYDRLKK